MKIKAIEVLQKLAPDEPHFKAKLKLVSEVISNPNMGQIVPDKLVGWCKQVGLNMDHHCEDKTSWWSISNNQ